MRFIIPIVITGFGLFNLFIMNGVDSKTAIFFVILGLVAIPFELLFYYLTWGDTGFKKPILGDVKHE